MQCLRSSALSQPDPSRHGSRQSAGCTQEGFSLVELLVVSALLVLCLLVGTVTLSGSSTRASARAAAQVGQVQVASAQLTTLWAGGPAKAAWTAESAGLIGPAGVLCEDLADGIPVSANVTRWRMADSVRVTVGGLFAAPDSAGSVTFGSSAAGTVLVVRAESGLTRRSSQ